MDNDWKELKSLYEERKMTGLWKLCRKEMEAGRENAAICGYYACACASRNSLSRISLKEGNEAFLKASRICENQEEKKRLYEIFTKEVTDGIRRVRGEMQTVSKTKSVIGAYRDCMRLSADALLLAVRVGEEIGQQDVLSVQKEAASCMVWLCAVEKYENDMGKYVVKGIDNAPEEIRVKYTALYDSLVERIKEQEPAYVPQEIQREYVDPRFKEYTEEKPENEKKGLLRRLSELLEKGKEG